MVGMVGLPSRFPSSVLKGRGTDNCSPTAEGGGWCTHHSNCTILYDVIRPAMEALHLDRNHIRSHGAVTIGNGLKLNRGILDLSLSYNEIDDVGAAAIGEAGGNSVHPAILVPTTRICSRTLIKCVGVFHQCSLPSEVAA